HPPRDLEGGPRELVALDEVQAREQVVYGGDVLADQARGHVLAHGVVRGQRVLRRVVRHVGRTALAPGVLSPALHAHEQRVGVELVPVRRLPHERQRHLDPVDVDPLDDHFALTFRSSYGAAYEKPLMWSTLASPSTRGPTPHRKASS